MAAPRKYSDAQRQAMYRLYEAGKTPAEIASLAEQGMAGCGPFTIPRRTVHDIVTTMAEEAERKLPTSVAEAESAEAVERYPARIARIVNDEIERLEAKQRGSHGLSPGDLDRLARLAELSGKLEKRLSRRKAATRRGAGQRTESAQARESALEKLAREQGDGGGEEDQPSPPRSHHASPGREPDPPAHEPSQEPPRPDPDAPVEGAVPKREDAAERAREALAAAPA